MPDNITFALNENGDIYFDGQNNIQLIQGENEQNQAFGVLLGINKGEWFLNSALGLAYSYLQVKNPDITRIRAEIATALQQEPRFKALDSLNVDLNNRKLAIDFKATLISGETLAGNEVLNI